MKEIKKQLRRQVRQEKTRYNISTLNKWSAEILAQVESLPEFQNAHTILVYFSMNDEVDTQSFIEKWAKHKVILLPAIVNDELEIRIYSGPDDLIAGAYGISEPVGQTFTDLDTIDLVIVPGMAFDKSGNRLGRGKGYYDKLLRKLQAPCIGICFPFQLLSEIPMEEFDIPMHKVITASIKE